jgi:hypothetical protein
MMLGREINIPKNILLSECSTKEPEDTDDWHFSFSLERSILYILQKSYLERQIKGIYM